MEHFKEDKLSPAEELSVSLERQTAMQVVEESSEAIRKLGRGDVHEYLASTLTDYFTNRGTPNVDRTRIHEIYHAGIALGHKLYVEPTHAYNQEEVWSKLSELCETLDLTMIEPRAQTPLALHNFQDAFLHSQRDHALAAAKETGTKEQEIIELFSTVYTRVDWDIGHFNLAVGLVADAVNIAHQDILSSSATLELSSPEIRKSTLALYRETCETMGLNLKEDTETLLPKLEPVIEHFNGLSSLELLYKHGANIRTAQESVYAIQDARNGSMTFRRLKPGQLVEGSFAQFAYGLIPEYGEYEMLQKPTPIDEIQELSPVGLYLFLEGATFTSDQGSEVPIGKDHRLLIPLNYDGQHVTADRLHR